MSDKKHWAVKWAEDDELGTVLGLVWGPEDSDTALVLVRLDDGKVYGMIAFREQDWFYVEVGYIHAMSQALQAHALASATPSPERQEHERPT